MTGGKNVARKERRKYEWELHAREEARVVAARKRVNSMGREELRVE